MNGGAAVRLRFRHDAGCGCVSRVAVGVPSGMPRAWAAVLPTTLDGHLMITMRMDSHIINPSIP